MLEVWLNFQGYVYGGVSFIFYCKQFEVFFLLDDISYQEIYNVFEGYFVVQDDFSWDDMLLLFNNGVYYEFLFMIEWDKFNFVVVFLYEV